MSRTLAFVLGAGVSFLAVVPVWAHHAFSAEFDSSKPIKLRGTVTKMEWINPHAWIHIDVKSEDGTVSPWMIEAAAPNSLLRRGFTKNSLLAGMEILVTRQKMHRPARTAALSHSLTDGSYSSVRPPVIRALPPGTTNRQKHPIVSPSV